MVRSLASLALALSIGSAATGDPNTPTAKTPSLTGARSIRIDDRWVGLSLIAPTSAVFALARDGDRIHGTADFSVNSGEGVLHQKPQQLEIPLDAFEMFLALLSELEIRSVPYKPTFTHTDDYPSITIEIEGDGRRVVFFSRSQGERHTPWAVTIGETDFVLTADSPQRALDVLSPYLKWEVFERFKRDQLDRELRDRRPTSR